MKSFVVEKKKCHKNNLNKEFLMKKDNVITKTSKFFKRTSTRYS